MNSNKVQNIVIGITGASGSIYAKTLLNYLQQIKLSHNLNISLIFSETGQEVAKHELGNDFLEESNVNKYRINDYNAPFASGSSVADAMVIVPCSMGTLGRVAHGTSDNLICRTADVILKERKRLILVTRETPLNLIHIKNMELITLAGGIILPASPSFYLQAKSIEDLINSVVFRILDLLNLNPTIKRWGKES